MTNWNALTGSTFDKLALIGFAAKNVSGRSFYELHSGTETGGVVRNLLREHGVTYARRLARKALRRRGININV